MKRILAFLLICFMGVTVFSSCAKAWDNDRGGSINIAAMNGPTMMGLAKLYEDENVPNSNYTFSKEISADGVVAGLANKKYDVACLPANTAAIILNNGKLDIQVAAINTLNVLYLVQKASAQKVETLQDLAGKTVYMPGQGMTPETAFRYLFKENNITNVNLEFEVDGSAIVAGLKNENSNYDYAVLPQPLATMAKASSGAIEIMNLTTEWQKINPASDIVTGVLVVRRDFIKNNEQYFKEFLTKYQQSVNYMINESNLDHAADLIVNMGIIPNASLAKQALPKCGITYIDKEEMKTMLVDFYTVLYEQNKSTIGNKLPKDKFYYI